MGCKASKTVVDPVLAASRSSPGASAADTASPRRLKSKLSSSSIVNETFAVSVSSSQQQLYKLLIQAQAQAAACVDTDIPAAPTAVQKQLQQRILQLCANPKQASYQNPQSGLTPLHMACRFPISSLDQQLIVEALVRTYPDAVTMQDAQGQIPLHSILVSNNDNMTRTSTETKDDAAYYAAYAAYTLSFQIKAAICNLLITTNVQNSKLYLQRNDVAFTAKHQKCTPLYYAVKSLPDDFDSRGPTVDYIAVLREACGQFHEANATNHDTPLALLYRRFTRQFDLAEKFFPGDNSQPHIVQYRLRYKTAAGNTWRMMELILRPDDPSQAWRIVHRAVQVPSTPPDLLRYIVETNAEDLTVPDEHGNLPLHYAAQADHGHVYPVFYSKYIIDELLYKYPHAAQMPDADGNLPFTLAVIAHKPWIGGGVKSLYDAYPDALKQIDLDEYAELQQALSLLDITTTNNNDDTATEVSNSSNNNLLDQKLEQRCDEQHDAIMLVQQKDVSINQVVTSMWAHEEDAGVQMLSCVAITRMIQADKKDVLTIALVAVAGVVNAMKAHPNEVIVQEKACQALRAMAVTDGQHELSFVASGAVAATIGAMQAHVSDPGVQEEACGAIAEIIHWGGADRATIVASVSGMTAILNALAGHPNAVGVQHQGCAALKALTDFDNANLPELPRSQTEPLLEAAKEAFPNECGEYVDLILSRMST
jgi:ankyrin repeat protein